MEIRVLLLVSLSLLLGLYLVYQAKKQRPINFAEVPEKLLKANQTPGGQSVQRPGELLNLNQVKNADEVISYLTNFEETDEQIFAAGKIVEAQTKTGKIKNVGALGTIRITEDDLKDKQGLEYFKIKLENAKVEDQERKNKQEQNKYFAPVEWLRNLFRDKEKSKISIPLIRQVSFIKSSFIVRTPQEFRNSLITSTAIFLLAFWGLHLFWRIKGFQGDQIILPTIFALSGLGFLMMVSLRDPLRDTLSFTDFSWGVFIGSLSLALLTAIDYYQLYYTLKARVPRIDFLTTALPIGLALLLSLALIFFGTGPSGSDAKVNLNLGLPFQPSELIKILVVFFIAAYFSRHWELIQNLSERKIPILSIPRFKDVWAVFLCVTVVLVFFILQKDLGPAFLMAGLFLIMFAMVRGQLLLSVAGFISIIGGYLFNYYVLRFSQTAADRFDIWLSPWNTTVRGGEQIVQSFWALAAGGLSGTGLGLGEPRYAPAAHTDLILSSLGEELGFIGLFLIFALYAALLFRCVEIALNASSSYTFFLTLGVAIINALQILFISAAILGLIPLSGVVSPFLSYGSTSMIMNFIAFGIVLVVSGQEGAASADIKKTFTLPTKYISATFGLLALFVLANAAWMQVVKADEITLKSVLSPQGDEVATVNGTERKFVGIRRYQNNPRIRQILNELPYGTIYDRTGIPLASGSWEELEAHRQTYESLGVELEKVCRKGSRCYPFGSATFFLLGDVRTKKNWSSTNNYIEKDYEARLRGFDDHQTTEHIEVKQISVKLDQQTGEPIINPATGQPERKEEFIAFPILKHDYKELLPLISYRYLPINLEAYELRYKKRYVKTSIDIRLQLLLTRIVEDELKAANLTRGAVVVLNPQSGELLASVSYPYPAEATNTRMNNENDKDQDNDRDRLIDRARQGEKPPGSTFKIVTAIAAIKKDAGAFDKTFSCTRLDERRVGQIVRGKKVRDDEADEPHENIKFEGGLISSCNAYFAQLAVEVAGAEELLKTAKLFNIKVGSPNTSEELDNYLQQSSFGQGEVVATPFQMAKVAATIANHGTMPFGQWVIDENNLRKEPPVEIITREQSDSIAKAMLGVTTDQAHGTAYKAFALLPIQVAGKTGTAQNVKIVNGKNILQRPHSWFVGFAPFDKQKKIAFAVIVENGGYGSGIAAAISKKLVKSASDLGVI
jgi:cell division protein FtsW (lipid II flippase)